MLHGYLIYFRKPPVGGRPNTKPGDHGILNAHYRWFILFISYVRNCINKRIIEIAFGWGPNPNLSWLHTTLEGPWLHYMILEVCCDSLWILSCGLSQFHGHSSWLVCDVALRVAGDNGHGSSRANLGSVWSVRNNSSTKGRENPTYYGRCIEFFGFTAKKKTPK